MNNIPKNIKYKMKYSIVFALTFAIFASIIGFTFSYFSAKVIENAKTETKVKSNTLGLIYTGVKDINVQDIIPGDYMTKTFTIENTSNRAVDYNIYMEDITNEFNNDLVYELKDGTNTVIEEGPLPTTASGKTYIKTKVSIDTGVTKSYTLTIKFLYKDDEDQNINQGKVFNTILGIDTEDVEGKYSLIGTVYDENGLVTSGNMVIFSEKQDLIISVDGKFKATNLEMGNHEIYYMGNIDPTELTKDEIIEQAICLTNISTKNNEDIIFVCNGANQLYIRDVVVQKEEQSESNKIASLVTDINSNGIADIGDEICIGSECFNVIKNENGTIDMLAKYNLKVGSIYSPSWKRLKTYTSSDEGYGLQSEEMLAYYESAENYKGTVQFYTSSQKGTNNSDYAGSLVEKYVNSYVTLLSDMNEGLNVTGRLINDEELTRLGCSNTLKSCSNALSFVYNTTYWTATPYDSNYVWCVRAFTGRYDKNTDNAGDSIGVRPLLTIDENLI